MAKDVPIGTRAEVTQIVEHKHTLSALGPELPPVLATPWMIGWMEYACYQAQQPFCDEGLLSGLRFTSTIALLPVSAKR